MLNQWVKLEGAWYLEIDDFFTIQIFKDSEEEAWAWGFYFSNGEDVYCIDENLYEELEELKIVSVKTMFTLFSRLNSSLASVVGFDNLIEEIKS